MGAKGKPFTSETARAAGKKSKRKKLDIKMQEFLQRASEVDPSKTNEQVLFDAAFEHAKDGNSSFFTELMNRAYGKAKQPITGDPDEPIQAVIYLDKQDKDL